MFLGDEAAGTGTGVASIGASLPLSNVISCALVILFEVALSSTYTLDGTRSQLLSLEDCDDFAIRPDSA